MSLHALSLFITVKILPLLYAIIGFGALIGIHEFGHFIFCKLFGIHTPTFSIGFGPELFSRKIGRTNFRLALIPLGGYCEIAGSAEVGQGDQAFADARGSDSFADKPYWQKLLVLSGGIIFNLMFAYIVFCSLFLIGSSEPQAVIIDGIVKESAAEKYGLKQNDGIIQINDKKLLNASGAVEDEAIQILLDEIKVNANKDIQLVVLRDNKTETLTVHLDSKKEDVNHGSLGIAGPRTPIQRLPFLQAISRGIEVTNYWIVKTVQSVKNLITQRSLEGAGGPVMIMSMSFASAQRGFLMLFTFLALISINLALLNLLPLGALDGGQILFTTIEAIIGRKLPDNLRNGINIASWILFMGLAVYLTYKDIALLFGDKITALYNKIVSLVR